MLDDFYKLLFDDTPDALITTSPDGRVLTWNHRAVTTFGYRVDEAVGFLLTDLIVPPDRLAEDRAARDEALSRGSVTYESLRRRQDGSPVYVNIATHAVRNADGTVARFVTSERDITYLRAVRDAKLLEARYRDLLDSTPDAIIIANNTGRIVLANRQAESLFDYPRAELLGQPVEVLLPARYRAMHLSHRSTYFGQPRTRPMGAGLELYGLRKGGEEFPVEISLSPLQTEEGTLVSSSIRDVTERKAFEAKLQEANLQLENASRAKDRFLAGMSHELRTPLNAIIGFTGTLLMRLPGPLTTDQETQLRTVQKSARHLLSLINDLLDLAKIESGSVELTLESVDCRHTVEEVASSLRPMAEEKGLRFEVVDCPADLRVRADRRALCQILLNLTSNAIKFTEQGSVRLAVIHHPDTHKTMFRVTDSGIGIAPENLARLFQPFTQVPTSSIAGLEGTGLGLHLSRKLAELMAGVLELRSEPGVGTELTLCLSNSDE